MKSPLSAKMIFVAPILLPSNYCYMGTILMKTKTRVDSKYAQTAVCQNSAYWCTKDECMKLTDGGVNGTYGGKEV